MEDLKRAIDAVPDGPARAELIACRSELVKYQIEEARLAPAMQANLKGNPTEIMRCETERLPDLDR